MTKKLLKIMWTPSKEDFEEEKTWLAAEVKKIGETVIVKLAQAAAKVRKNAYRPYSGYSVGAAVLTVTNNTYTSCNAEVVSYTETDHAERSAITKAISEGEMKKSGRKFIRAIAISHPGDSGPCGGCRQRIAEHADNAIVMDVDAKGHIQKITSLRVLLPYAFTPTHLGK